MLSDIVVRIERELEAAENARAMGNEGRARVSARRAAGIAIQAYYSSRGEHIEKNVIDSLMGMKNDPLIISRWKEYADLLLTHVTEDHALPVQKDLVAETRLFTAEIIEDLKRKSIER